MKTKRDEPDWGGGAREEADEPARPASALSGGVAPGVRRAQEAYWRDLPDLLPLCSPDRRWVAYHGDKRLGFARTLAELYQEAARHGVPTSELYVDRLAPRALPPWEAEEIEAAFEADGPAGPRP
jgi:hypothetical protein